MSSLAQSGSLRNDDGNGYDMERNSLKHNNNRKFKKLRRLLQASHFKIEPCITLSVSRLFHVHHVEQNRRSPLSLALQECFLQNERFTAAGSPCRHNFKYVNFTSLGRLCRKSAAKSVPHVQDDYFSLFNQ